MAPTKRAWNAATEEEKPRLPRIKWGCDEETFSKKEGDSVTEYSIATYYKDIYDIEIQYPNMPIISTSRGWFPVEFFYQERSRAGGNESDKVRKVLEYHDRFAGQARLDHVKMVMERAFTERSIDSRTDDSLASVFKDFDLSVDTSQSLSSPAKRLPAPMLQFRDTVENLEKSEYQGGGSWNLKRKKFFW